MLSDYGQRLRIFLPIKTAQTLVVFEMCHFFWFSKQSIFFLENLRVKGEVPQNLYFPTLNSGTVRVLSGFANFTSKATVHLLFVSKMSRFLVDFKFFQR